MACHIRLAAVIHLSVGDDVFYSFGAMSTLGHKQLVLPQHPLEKLCIQPEAERISSMETPNYQSFRDEVDFEVSPRPPKARPPRYNSSHASSLSFLETALNNVSAGACARVCASLASYYRIPTAVATMKNIVSRRNGKFHLFSYCSPLTCSIIPYALDVVVAALE